MITFYIDRKNNPEPWDKEKHYLPGERCTHKGKTWKAADTGINNPSIEPGGFAIHYWLELKGE